MLWDSSLSFTICSLHWLPSQYGFTLTIFLVLTGQDHVTVTRNFTRPKGYVKNTVSNIFNVRTPMYTQLYTMSNNDDGPIH